MSLDLDVTLQRPGFTLAARFASPVLLHHDHGHALVQRAEHCNAVVDFVRRHTKAPPAQ